MALQESGEMYLESIYMLSKEKEDVHAIDICDYMGYSKPSVSRAMGILKKGGYITVSGSGSISLTMTGLEVAENMYERHTMLTEFLKKLGVSESTASADACKIEHVISKESFIAIQNYTKSK